jgi:hypothetical protein
MAANMTITEAPSGGGIELMRSRRGFELIKIVGSTTAVDDTGTYTPKKIKADANTVIIGGCFFISSVSGGVITIGSKIALGNATVWVWLAEGL